ncbi:MULTISPECIES: hypothetical protein [unclassified Streptomyces]|uniref:hypothetical protein n=1 Tax=unclassified Streptomyces TaxID=2593676 RepID=UPI002F9137D0
MDPITVQILLALAGGAGGAVAAQGWVALTELVHRPFQRRNAEGGVESVQPAPGVNELQALQNSPTDGARAQDLAAALQLRADEDPEFRQSLLAWQQRHSRGSSEGQTHNTVRGSNYGNLLMADDVHGPISFTTPPPSPPGDPEG